jgi:hypothetical protein
MADPLGLKGILGGVKDVTRVIKDVTDASKDIDKILDTGGKGIGQIKELLGEQTSINIGTVSKQAASVEVLLERHGFAGFDAKKKDGKISSNEYARIADFIVGKPGLDGEITRNGRDIVLSKKAIDTLTAEPAAIAPTPEKKAEAPESAASAPAKDCAMGQAASKVGGLLGKIGVKVNTDGLAGAACNAGAKPAGQEQGR